jgi:hypothetical protein
MKKIISILINKYYNILFLHSKQVAERLPADRPTELAGLGQHREAVPVQVHGHDGLHRCLPGPR